MDGRVVGAGTIALTTGSRVVSGTETNFTRYFKVGDPFRYINNNSTGHSEAIISSDQTATKEFARRVDAAAVLVNTSTRFVDGEEFGFGAEIGISTQKLHARGPMGLEQLTTTKYIVNGQGQTRG